jgi:hypothetical protein
VGSTVSGIGEPSLIRPRLPAIDLGRATGLSWCRNNPELFVHVIDDGGDPLVRTSGINRSDRADGHRNRRKDARRLPIKQIIRRPGLRNVDPNDAINSKTPVNKLLGSITPSDLHYERSHAGVPATRASRNH